MASVRPRSVRKPRSPRRTLILFGVFLLALAAFLATMPQFDSLSRNLGLGGTAESSQTDEVSLVVAARDTEYCGYHTACGPGLRTDTIFYVRLRGTEATLVALPRDLLYTFTSVVPDDGFSYKGKINSVYERGGGAEGLRRAVENVLGVPVEHYVILTFDSIMKLVNAVDGVDVNLPFPMKYTDRAAGLFIDFSAGPRHLDGKDAVKYMRFRRWEGSDLGRLDRIKGLLSQIVQKAQQPRYWPRLPAVAADAWNKLETTLSLPTALSLLPNLRGLTLKSATVPTLEQGNNLILDEPAMASFRAGLLGYQADSEATVPITAALGQGLKVLLLDQSGTGLAEQYRAGLLELGLPLPEIQISAEVRPTTAVYVRSGLSIVGRESPTFALARSYADLMHLPLQTQFRLEPEGFDVVIAIGSNP